MATGDILSVNSNSSGLAINTGGTVDWDYSSWTQIVASTSTPIYIIGVSFQTNENTFLSADTTREMLFEIATGANGAETLQIQIPYSYRRDTTVGFYLTPTHNIFLPEPFEVSSGTRISVRLTDNTNIATSYDGIKIWYQEGSNPVSSTVKDIIGFGILSFPR